MGAAALRGYKMVENNLSTNRSENNLSVNADKVSGKASISSINKNNFMPDTILNYNNSSNSESKTTYEISALDVEQLKLDLSLQQVVLYLLILVLIFLILKALSDKNLIL